MATFSRTTWEDSDDSNNETTHNNKYSTLFSTKLIDLAISVDAEVAAAANQRQATGLGGGVSKEKKNENLLDIRSNLRFKYTELKSIQRSCQDTMFNGHSGRTQNSSSGKSKKGFPVSSASSSTKTNGTTQNQNLLTVFSSPCTDYFPSPKRTDIDDSDEELPEYVRMMMEKDLALKRLVKTGSVTISQVKPEAGSDDEKYLDEEDFLYDDEYEEEKGERNEIGYRRPYVPPANIQEWENFPFAKRLLELTHLSVSQSSSSTGTSPTQSEGREQVIRSRSNHLINNNGIIMITKEKKPFPVSSIPCKSRVCSKAKITPILPNYVPNYPKKKSKPPQPAAKKVLANQRPLLRTIQDTGKKVNNSRTRNKRLSNTAKPASDTEEHSNSFQVDPMKFLEISLQEGKIPDDSHRRKYKCGFCEKKFCWSTDLKRHTLIHTGERPFKCPECPANFTRKFLMQKHLKKVHQPTVVVTTHPVSQGDFNATEDFLGLAQNYESGDDGYGQDLEFLSAALKNETPEDDNFEDLEDTRGGSDEDELDTAYTGEARSNVTYLDF